MIVTIDYTKASELGQKLVQGLAPLEAIMAAVAIMKEDGFTPFTRRDVFAVLGHGGYTDKAALMTGWKKTPSFPRVKSAGRGFLTFPKAAAPRRKKKAKAAPPRKLTTEELAEANVVARAGISWVPAEPQAPSNIYAEDAGLAHTAAEGTKCYTTFDESSSACASCPLAFACSKATLLRYAEVARDLDNEIAQALAAIAAKKAAEAAADPRLADASDGDKSSALGQLSQMLESGLAVRRSTPFTSPCSGCGGLVEAGEQGVHIQGHGFFHDACANVAVLATS